MIEAFTGLERRARNVKAAGPLLRGPTSKSKSSSAPVVLSKRVFVENDSGFSVRRPGTTAAITSTVSAPWISYREFIASRMVVDSVVAT